MEVYFVAYTCGKQGAFVGIDNEVNRHVCDRILKFQNIVQHYVRYKFLSSFIGRRSAELFEDTFALPLFLLL